MFSMSKSHNTEVCYMECSGSERKGENENGGKRERGEGEEKGMSTMMARRKYGG